MARHSGKDGKAKLNDVFIGGLTNWNINEKAAAHDTSAAGEAWADSEPGMKSWTASITVRLDFDEAANQTVRAGDVIDIECYSEGDATGKTYLSGSIMIEDHGISSPFDSTTERTYSGVGKGALSMTKVPA